MKEKLVTQIQFVFEYDWAYYLTFSARASEKIRMLSRDFRTQKSTRLAPPAYLMRLKKEETLKIENQLHAQPFYHFMYFHSTFYHHL